MCVCVLVFTCAWACKRTPVRVCVCVCVSSVVEEMRRQATQNTPLFTDAVVTTATYMKTGTRVGTQRAQQKFALEPEHYSLITGTNYTAVKFQILK